MASERPRYTLSLVVPRRKVVQVGRTFDVLHLPPAPRLTHQLVMGSIQYQIRVMKPTPETRPLPPDLETWNINPILATLIPIDVSVMRSRLLIHAQQRKSTLQVQDVLTPFHPVFQTEEDVRYFMTVHGDGWFVPQGTGAWKVRHPDWWH